MINRNVLSKADEFSGIFQQARPFKYLCIDSFFEGDDAELLLSDFPPFDTRKATNEFGEVGRKAVHTGLKDISPAYAKFYDYLLSEDFLNAMSAMTGIPDLLPDPRMYGGGTHENVHGQSMDPHVDFNYDQDHGYHRRLNLIVYLNKDWREEWGGALELHSNPRDTESNQVIELNCIFNRAVIFETNEYSWHGFKRVNLPKEEEGRSRKSLSIYLYTKNRPKEEVAPPHGTFYVQRPLSFHAQEGAILNKGQVKEIEDAIKGRDKWIRHYQNLELNLASQIQTASDFIKELLASIKAPITGLAKPAGRSQGLYHDGWIASCAQFGALAQSNISTVTIKGFIPDSVTYRSEVSVLIDGEEQIKKQVGRGSLDIQLPLNIRAGKSVTFEIQSKRIEDYRPHNSDQRDLAFVLLDVIFSGKD
jgi:hypothetical protein